MCTCCTHATTGLYAAYKYVSVSNMRVIYRSTSTIVVNYLPFFNNFVFRQYSN